MRKLDVWQSAWEPQDLVVFARVTLFALREIFTGSQLRIPIPNFRMAFNTLLV
jgi:hypothetical protein